MKQIHSELKSVPYNRRAAGQQMCFVLFLREKKKSLQMVEIIGFLSLDARDVTRSGRAYTPKYI